MEILALMMEITDELMSVMLLKASVITAMLLMTSPRANFTAKEAYCKKCPGSLRRKYTVCAHHDY
nr:hypothetical protein [Anoxynatronum buryatiense]